MKLETKRAICLFFIITLITSCSKIRNKEMEVIKDCTGVYLRFNNKDYQVCNEEKLAAYSNGEHVTATFKKIKNCTLDRIVCMMHHESEGFVDVQKIN